MRDQRYTTRSVSLPSRERGLKYARMKKAYRRRGSLPSRERGLKYTDVMQRVMRAFQVAPFTGAWIEILMQNILLHVV